MYLFKPASLWLLPTVLATSTHVAEQRLLPPATFCPREPFGAWRVSGVCPVDGPSALGNESTTRSPGDEWRKGTLCHEIPGGSEAEFCTFTHASFHHGLGVSIITTPEVFRKLSQMPVLKQHGAAPGPLRPNEASPPYRDVPIPGKGIGLVAARPVEAAEVYMARTPAVMLDDTAFRLLGRARLTALLTQAVDDLPHAHRAEYLTLTAHDEVEHHADRVYQIFMKNNFRTEIQGVEVFHSAFTQGKHPAVAS